MVENVIIIGAGQAAVSAIAQLRDKGFTGAIVLVGDEPHLPYQRPPLSKKYLIGEFAQERLQFKAPEWYDDMNVSIHLDDAAQSIDCENQIVRLTSGLELNYGHLIIATGASPRILPASIGGALENVFIMRAIAHADALSSHVVAGRKMLVVGGGYIGLEGAAIAASQGVDVTVIEMGERILQRVAAKQTSDYFRTLHQSHNVKILENTGLDHLIEKDGKAIGAILSDGSKIDADFVVVGIGAGANSAIAADAGLEVEGAIVVDKYCQTSDPRIFAIGDCAVVLENGVSSRIESVHNAIEQGKCAAENILGGKVCATSVPWFWSDQYDVKLQIAGMNTGFDATYVRPGARENSQSVWYYKDDHLIAVDAMNDPAAYMMGKKLLEAGKNISPEIVVDAAARLKDYL